MCFKDFFLFLELMALLFNGMELFRQFWSYEEHLSEIILNLGQQFRRRWRLMIFLF